MLDESIEKEIKKCSRCALCLQNCPIYEIKKDENNTSRGLICKLNGYQKNILSEGRDISITRVNLTISLIMTWRVKNI